MFGGDAYAENEGAGGKGRVFGPMGCGGWFRWWLGLCGLLDGSHVVCGCSCCLVSGYTWGGNRGLDYVGYAPLDFM